MVDLSVAPPKAPEVDPEARQDIDAAQLLETEDQPAPQVDESVVRGLVKGIGSAANRWFGDEDVPELWRFSDQELADLVPPLTRYVNARPRLRAAVVRGDEMTIALVLAGYAGRNVDSLRRAQRERDGEAEPAAGRNGAGAGGVGGSAGNDGGGGVGLRHADGGVVAG